ncbi:MAG: ABC transporter permease [Acidobacteriia bacterium]|nr:ABC transporter permease [Terriglobia bacterium]
MIESLRVLRSRIAGFLLRRRPEREFDQEIEEHLTLLAEENTRRGMTPADARLAARRSFGESTRFKETQRELRGLPRIDTFVADLRYAFRALAKNPGFTLVAVLTLAIGIGVNTTLFTAYNAIALKPLPVPDPNTVVRFERWFEHGMRGDIQYGFSYPEYEYLRDHGRAFKSLIAAGWPVPVSSASGRLAGQMVSGNYFQSLEVGAVLGRTFLPDEDGAPGAHPVIVLSHNFWKRRFNLDPRVLGQTLKLNDTVFTIVGVTPEEFTGTLSLERVPDFWAPFAMQAQLAPGLDWLHDLERQRLVILARLAGSTMVNRAQAEATVLMRQFASSHQEREKTVALTLQRVTYYGNTDDLKFQALVAALMLLVGLVLLIACANLANMLLARAASRQREIAVRLSLGAGRGRIIRQLLTESTLLALLGGAAGLLLSIWSAKLLWIQVQQMVFGSAGDIDTGVSLAPDSRVFLYTLAVSVLTGIAFGLSPALQFSRVDLTSAIKQEGATFGRRLSHSRLRSFLVTGQVAASMLLLVIAGLLLRGLVRSQDAQPGFQTRGVFVVSAAFGDNPAQAAALEKRVYERLSTLGELEGAAMGNIPMTGTWTPPILVNGTRSRTLASTASAGYLPLLGIPIVRGRNFTTIESDRGAPVAIVSANTARLLWPNQDPLGKRFTLDMDFTGKIMSEFEVVGVAADVRFANLSRLDPAHVYLTGQPRNFSQIVIRMPGDRERGLAAVRAAVAGVDRDLLQSLAMFSFEEGPLRIQRVLAQAYAMFAMILAALAVTLAGVGIYGVMSYLVSQRVKEIGVFMALGANSSDVLKSVIGQGLRPVAAGSLLGLVCAAGLSKVINATLIFPGSADFLYGLSWWDPVTFFGIAAFLALVAMVASAIPARRAVKVDPMVALRYE